MNKELLLLLTPVAFCHALGHVMSNVSFAAVAVSFTHTIKGIKDFLQKQIIISSPVRTNLLFCKFRGPN
jgi:hypothetical protein